LSEIGVSGVVAVLVEHRRHLPVPFRAVAQMAHAAELVVQELGAHFRRSGWQDGCARHDVQEQAEGLR
jgi:hypothetical protein